MSNYCCKEQGFEPHSARHTDKQLPAHCTKRHRERKHDYITVNPYATHSSQKPSSRCKTALNHVPRAFVYIYNPSCNPFSAAFRPALQKHAGRCILYNKLPLRVNDYVIVFVSEPASHLVCIPVPGLVFPGYRLQTHRDPDRHKAAPEDANLDEWMRLKMILDLPNSPAAAKLISSQCNSLFPTVLGRHAPNMLICSFRCSTDTANKSASARVIKFTHLNAYKSWFLDYLIKVQERSTTLSAFEVISRVNDLNFFLKHRWCIHFTK